MGLIDMLMFSINPAYDYRHGEYAIGSVDERTALYRRCEAEGVGISVMKAFSAGQLLNAKTSPFKQALTEYQCIQYALDKPGVVTVLPGVRGREDLKRILGFLDASPEEKDYSVLGTFAPQDAEGICVYCNHCQPCPAGLDVGLINKYYDLAQAGDVSAAAQLLLAVWRSPYDEKITNRLMQASLQRLLMIFSPQKQRKPVPHAAARIRCCAASSRCMAFAIC